MIRIRRGNWCIPFNPFPLIVMTIPMVECMGWNYHGIGWWENLQASLVFDGKNCGFFSLKPIHWNYMWDILGPFRHPFRWSWRWGPLLVTSQQRGASPGRAPRLPRGRKNCKPWRCLGFAHRCDCGGWKKPCTTWKRWSMPWFVGFQPSFWWCRIGYKQVI